MHAGCRNVDRQLADRDAHPPGALVTQPKDSLVVGHHDQSDIAVGGVAQELRQAIDVVGSEPQAARAAEDVAERLAGEADRRRIDDWHQLLQVVAQQAIEQRLVAVLEGRQPDVPLEVVRLASDMLELKAGLLGERERTRRQEPAQPERVALVVGECRVLVQ